MMLLKELILIRHGESEHLIRDLTGGWTDCPLTDLGRLQADTVAKALAAKGVSRGTILLSSDLQRARETTAAIEMHTGLKAKYHMELRELNR